MRRMAALILAVGLLVVACGDDDASTADTSATSSRATTEATSAPTTSTTAPATTAPATTAPETTTEAPGNPLVQAALAFQGDHVGQWNNTTFGSTGSVAVSVDVNEDAALVVITLDLGGSVFGGIDPDPIVFELDLVLDPPYASSDDLFGASTADISDDGTVTIIAAAVPGLGGLTMIVEGIPDPGGFQMVYSILNPDSSVFAEGTVDLAPAG